MVAWFLRGHHVEMCSGVYVVYYARMLPLRSRYCLDFVFLLTVPDSSLAPRLCHSASASDGNDTVFCRL